MARRLRMVSAFAATAALVFCAPAARAEGEWETTPASEKAARMGLEWLAANQGREGNWQSNDLGLVAMGALAFLSAGHAPGRGKYGENVQRALDYVMANAKPSGLINMSGNRRDMYNHGLATFVLTQAYGTTQDQRAGKLLDKALRLIANVQCEDGGWDYEAARQKNGHDLSLAVMQAKALRGAMDIGFEIDPRTVQLAIKSVRSHYKPFDDARRRKRADGSDATAADVPGQFTYDGSRATTAMAAAGVVCLQEFGKYDDYRIYRSMDVVCDAIDRKMPVRTGSIPFDAYTTYYVAQALYQVGGERWKRSYPKLRDAVVKTQWTEGGKEGKGSWEAGSHVSGVPGRLFGTSVAVFVLSIPNRYLPILQQGYVEPKDAKGKDAPKKADAGTRELRIGEELRIAECGLRIRSEEELRIAECGLRIRSEEELRIAECGLRIRSEEELRIAECGLRIRSEEELRIAECGLRISWLQTQARVDDWLSSVADDAPNQAELGSWKSAIRNPQSAILHPSAIVPGGTPP